MRCAELALNCDIRVSDCARVREHGLGGHQIVASLS